MSIGSAIIEMLRAVLLEPASLAATLFRRKGAQDFPINKCAECHNLGEVIQRTERSYRYRCAKCGSEWVQLQRTYSNWARKPDSQSTRRNHE